MSYSLNSLYREVGISKQAVSQYMHRQRMFDSKVEELVLAADLLREEHPGCGVEKMYYTLQPDFIGRDRFIELMMDLGYRVRQIKNYHRTTFSGSIYYPNLIQGMRITRPNVVWQSDITYIRVGDSFYYVVFIIDVYTKRIVGYAVSDHLRATANLQALRMALVVYGAPEVHHSDRGSQYTCKDYIVLLQSNEVKISMGLTAQDNAYAERINQTIKNEYLAYWKPTSFNALKRDVQRAVEHYNTKRIHNHLSRMTPLDFEAHWQTLSEELRPVETIFNPNQLYP